MTAKDLKIEIQKVLETVPENLLEDVLLYLKEVQKKSGAGFSNAQHLKKILSEDRNLLQRLAQ
ncbi:hypothetical protein [Rufibacter sp. LB8]|uniref:hypothetical protein n=1 Tax=Rufibacter sp. LB8 TaxID=2777781 RepID=UPI00178C521D|nr:hypothetical protein [Rufibacter sp. LB8]